MAAIHPKAPAGGRLIPFLPSSPLSVCHFASFLWRRQAGLAMVLDRRRPWVGGVASASAKQKQDTEIARVEEGREGWGKVSAVLFDMDGVLCNSEVPSRLAAVDVFSEMGTTVSAEDFIPFMGTGEAKFLGGVAKAKGVTGFDPEAAKKRFFEIYIEKYARPDSGIGFPGAAELILQCKRRGLKVAVASSADMIKVKTNLSAAGLELSTFDAAVSADAFENLKPAPDIFLAAAERLKVPSSECVVIEDSLAGIQAAKAAEMRCIALSTTLSIEELVQARPSLIRLDIGNISIHDILNGGTSCSHNVFLEHNLSEQKSERERKKNDSDYTIGMVDIFQWLKSSRRDIVRYGSLGVALSSLIFTITNWNAMQYASLKGVLNLFAGSNPTLFEEDQEKGGSSQIERFKQFLLDFETSSPSTNVPEFPSNLDWLNTAPLKFQKDLKGRVVLLDFWTYCCINCMHILPDLEYLERKYSNKPFTVIGVHSAKFDNEKDLDAIRNAVLRYNITHPVVNDSDMYMWRELGVNSWPTFVVVSPTGKVLAQVSGEGHRRDLDDLIDATIHFYGEKKLLENYPLPLALESASRQLPAISPLKFPGKVAVDDINHRLFISDSNHNRIVVTDMEGSFILQVGNSGESGYIDGSFDVAAFNRPQGLAYNPIKDLLYVADTENHSLREIDFVSETVRTLAGNGTKGSDYKGGKGTDQALNSPWDLCYDPDKALVYIAMAGQHQIWVHSTLDGVTRAFSGDGFERNLNGSSSSSTSFSQPSGVSLSQDMQELYVADSESSSIRAVDLKTGGSRLLAGGDSLIPDNLFRFGDRDGIGSDALFQHPLGVFCGTGGHVYIADSYNHKIKKLDPISRKVTTLAGTGKAGFKSGTASLSQLSEPSGLVEARNGRLFIADTNNNAIRYLDLNKKDLVLNTLELKGVEAALLKLKTSERTRRRPSNDRLIVPANGGSASEGDLSFTISLLQGYHFSREAHSKFDVEVEPEEAVQIHPSSGFLTSNGAMKLHFSRALSSPATGRVNCKVYYCKDDEVCLYQSLVFEVSFQEDGKSSPSNVQISYTVVPRTYFGASQILLGGSRPIQQRF